MKICPYCNQKIPEEETNCPECGKEYWVPGKAEEKKVEEDQKLGCLQILLMPLIIALFSVSFLILCGFIINLLVNFESNQIKIVWIISSFLLGLVIYILLSKNKKQRGK